MASPKAKANNPNCEWNEEGNIIKIQYGHTYTTKNCSKMTCKKNGHVHGIGPPLVNIMCKDGEVQQPLKKEYGCKIKCIPGNKSQENHEKFIFEKSGKKSKKSILSLKYLKSNKLSKIDVSGDGKTNHAAINTTGDGDLNTILPNKILKKLKKKCSSRSKKGCKKKKKCKWVSKKKKCIRNICYKKTQQKCEKKKKCKWLKSNKKCVSGNKTISKSPKPPPKPPPKPSLKSSPKSPSVVKS